MNLHQTGKFIAECRKAVGLTQFELAEKLNISDRAVSKWETGKGMPDSLIMLRLCDILKINVNELLSGERLDMKSYNKKAEENLLALKKQNEEQARKLLSLEWVIGISGSLSMIALFFIGSFVEMPTFARIILITIGIIILIMTGDVCLRIERYAGYYKCAECGHCYVPTYKKLLFAMHMGRTRKMTCPKCHKKSWQKKVLTDD